jgi:HK97 family phage major capsid protein
MADKTPSEVIKEKLDNIEQTVLAKVADIEKKMGDTDGKIRADVETKLAEMRATMEKQAEQLNAVNRNSLPGVEEDKDKFSFARYALLSHPSIGREVKNKKEYGFEVEVHDNLVRAQTAGDSTAGGYAVPTQLADTIIEPAIAAMPIYGLGIQTLNDVTGTFDIPILTSRGTAGHATENGNATEVSMAFGKYTMTPKRAAGYVKVSKRLVMQASGGIEAFIRKQLQDALRLEIHEKLVKGTGSSGQPTGITVATDFTTTAALSTAQFVLKNASNMITDLEEANVDTEGGSMGFLTRPIVVQGLKMERVLHYSGQTAGKGYVITPAIMSDAELADRVGVKFAKTTQVPTSGSGDTKVTSVIYGDWSKFLLAMWKGLDIRSSDVASDSSNNAFIQNMIFIIAEQEYDCVVTRPDAFCKVTDALASRTSWV